MGVQRSRAYLEAGADCVYPIMLGDHDMIRSFVERVESLVNVLLRPGAPDLDAMRQLMVARVRWARDCTTWP
jgi:2-methylisocitrate lyase-like PEP mutase family enzyme